MNKYKKVIRDIFIDSMSECIVENGDVNKLFNSNLKKDIETNSFNLEFANFFRNLEYRRFGTKNELQLKIYKKFKLLKFKDRKEIVSLKLWNRIPAHPMLHYRTCLLFSGNKNGDLSMDSFKESLSLKIMTSSVYSKNCYSFFARAIAMFSIYSDYFMKRLAKHSKGLIGLTILKLNISLELQQKLSKIYINSGSQSLRKYSIQFLNIGDLEKRLLIEKSHYLIYDIRDRIKVLNAKMKINENFDIERLRTITWGEASFLARSLNKKNSIIFLDLLSKYISSNDKEILQYIPHYVYRNMLMCLTKKELIYYMDIFTGYNNNISEALQIKLNIA